MAGKQLFAQIGVFALLGLNVGAYYVFWPHKDGAAPNEAKASAQEKGQTQLLPKKSAEPATPTTPEGTLAVEPKSLPTDFPNTALPLQAPVVPTKTSETNTDDDPIGKLLEHINKEKVGGPNPPTQVIPAAPRTGVTIAKEASGEKDRAPNAGPRTLTDAQPIEKKQPAPENVGVASAQAPRVAPSPWLLNMEIVGTQTQLTVKLRQPAVGQQSVEFRILCDRVEMKAPGAVQALGKVTFTGGGLKGACQRLTVPLHETHIFFEQDASVVYEGNPGSVLRGDRITWESTPATAETQPLAPADFRVAPIVPTFPSGLGTPK